ncbi:MAG: hypothetical protein QM775_21360 [Pirellulales bacterium]
MLRRILLVGLLAAAPLCIASTSTADDRYGAYSYAAPYVITPAEVTARPAAIQPTQCTERGCVDCGRSPRPRVANTTPPEARLAALRASVNVADLRSAVPATNNATLVRSRSRVAPNTNSMPRYAVTPSNDALAVLAAAEPVSARPMLPKQIDSQVVPAAYVVPVANQTPAQQTMDTAGNPLRVFSAFGTAGDRAGNPLR